MSFSSSSADAMDKYVLGIDLGTTSVKTSIVNTRNNHVEAYCVKETQSQYQYPTKSAKNKQDVSKIVSALHFCVSKLPKNLLGQISSIGVCCQMHGVVFWNNSMFKHSWLVVERERNVRFDVVPENVSGLYTWQDGRCDQAFLATLPVPRSHIAIASGFGIPTIFWIQQNQPEKLLEYQCAGTIGDFVVAMLCDLERPLMSEQNAAGWGYFNCSSMEWNRDILQEAGFPVRLLPEVVPAGSLAGRLADNWHSVPIGTPIGVAMGDIQCGTLSCLESPKDAVLSITTSAQITFVPQKFVVPDGQEVMLGGGVQHYPYFGRSFIAIAASLNGGNSLATFVRMLQQWALDLGYSVPQSKVWEKILALASDESASGSELIIRPTCIGERSSPELTGEMTNITPDALHLGGVFRALCHGVITNLHRMLPSATLHEERIVRILGNGKGLARNAILQKQIEEVYNLPLVMATPGGETSTGAAIAVARLVNKQGPVGPKLDEEAISAVL